MKNKKVIIGVSSLILVIALASGLYVYSNQNKKAADKPAEAQVQQENTKTETANSELTAQDEEEIQPSQTVLPTAMATAQPTAIITATPTVVATTSNLPFPNPKNQDENYQNQICATFSTPEECNEAISIMWIGQKYRNGPDAIDPKIQSSIHFGLFYLMCPVAPTMEFIPEYSSKEDCTKLLDTQTNINVSYAIYKKYGFKQLKDLILMGLSS